MSEQQNTKTQRTWGCFTLSAITFLILLVLKLLELISISWFWVFAPMIGYALLTIVILAVVIVPIVFAAFVAVFLE